MKTLSINEASSNLSVVLKQAIAGEEIGIRSDDTIVALRPLPNSAKATDAEPLPPREALRRLQEEARLTSAQAESYFNEVHAERLAAKLKQPMMEKGKLSLHERMKDFCGIVNSGIPDLATNKKHMEGFGRSRK